MVPMLYVSLVAIEMFITDREHDSGNFVQGGKEKAEEEEERAASKTKETGASQRQCHPTIAA